MPIIAKTLKQSASTVLLAAVASVVLNLSPALAGDGDMGPMSEFTRQPSVNRLASLQVADTGNEAYPNVVGRAGSRLVGNDPEVLVASGTAGTVQSANSLPSGATTGMADYVANARVQDWTQAHSTGIEHSIYNGAIASRK